MRSKTYEVINVLQSEICFAYFGFAEIQSSVIRFADATSFQKEAFSAAAEWPLYIVKGNVPKWDISIHLLEMRGQCAQKRKARPDRSWGAP